MKKRVLIGAALGPVMLVVVAGCVDDLSSSSEGSQAYAGAVWQVVEISQLSPSERAIRISSDAWIKFDNHGNLVGHDIVQRFTAPYTPTDFGYHAPPRKPADFGWYARENDALMDKAITWTVTGGDVTVTDMGDGKLRLEAKGDHPRTNESFSVVVARK